MKDRGFYTIKDQFFNEFSDPYLMDNKQEQRPHYFAFQDKATGLNWVVPMSSRTKKYEQIIQDRKQQGKPCDFLHVCYLPNGRKNAFLIQDMFPVADKYVASEYTIAGNPLVMLPGKDAQILERKARRFFNLVHNGVKLVSTQVDSLAIENELLKNEKAQP